MTFNVYRTTKGKIGEPVYAEIEAINPRTGRSTKATSSRSRNTTPTRCMLPPWILAGSDGALQIQIRCLTQTQYLGMAESDLYLLSSSGNFGFNYMKGLFGVWLQAMVLTAIGVFAGTFLSWPVALLDDHLLLRRRAACLCLPGGLLAPGRSLGGGPFESLIRIVSHDNQMTELTPTAGGRAGQDARLAGHAGDVDAGLPRAQFPGTRRQQHGRRRLHGELARS